MAYNRKFEQAVFVLHTAMEVFCYPFVYQCFALFLVSNK